MPFPLLGGKEPKEKPEVIEWRGGEGELVWKWPNSEIMVGSTVVVRPGQAAVFVRDGKIYGVLMEGRHVLTTMNIPFLKDLLGTVPVAGGVLKHMFKAEIYFVSLARHQGRVGGKAYAGNRFPVTYNGTYFYQIDKPEVFLREYAAGQGWNVDTVSVENFVRALVQSRLQKFIGDLPPKDFTEVMQVQNKAKTFLTTEFEQIGLKLIDLNITIELSPEFEKILPYLQSAETWDQLFRILQMQTLQQMAQSMGQNPAAGMGVGMGMGMLMPYMMGAGAPAAPAPVGYGYVQPQQPAPPQPQQAQAAGMKRCPQCGRMVPADAKSCPYCGYKFE